MGKLEDTMKAYFGEDAFLVEREKLMVILRAENELCEIVKRQSSKEKLLEN